MNLQPLPSSVSVPFSHGASYASVLRRRPEIELEIAARSPAGRLLGQPVRTTLLVDSGADITMIDEVYAAFLGVDLDQLPTIEVHGIGGSTFAHEGLLMMDLCGRWVPVPVWFCPNRTPGLLGREVVFDNLIVAFVHRQSTFLAMGV